ncbi:MAG: response regulator transcription factor [Verrucomicrobiota bacterium]
MSATIAILDSDRRYRENLAACLNRAPTFHCTAAYADGDTALTGFVQNPPDLVLLGLEEPQELEVLTRIHRAIGNTPIIALLPREDVDWIVQTLASGAAGYGLKSQSPAKLIEILEDVLRGQSPVSSEVARKLIDRVQLQTSTLQPQTGLSAREREILEFLAQGYPYKQIADSLAISINTVRTYVRRLYAKLEVPCRTHAVLKCRPAARMVSGYKEEKLLIPHAVS